MSIESFRAVFRQTTERGIFFDNASMGPVAPQVTQAMAQCMEQRQTMPMKYYRFAERVFPICKAQLAGMIGAEPEEIAFTENVTYGINSAAGSLPLKRGDNVIICDREFASNVYPWLRLQQSEGVEARIIPNQGGGLTVERLEQYADSHTKVVSMSSVQFSDGYAADMEQIGSWCREHGVYFVVDCAQSLGVRPMDVRRFGIDMLAGLASKWLLGPFATGFLYVRKELLPELIPPFVGADSVNGDVDAVAYHLDLKGDASRFEGGLPNAPGIAGLSASISVMEEAGLEEIQRQAWNVSGYFRDRLLSEGIDVAACARTDQHRSTIISYRTPGLQEAYQTLRDNSIACSVRCGMIRMGIHGYNTFDEADQVLSVLRFAQKRI